MRGFEASCFKMRVLIVGCGYVGLPLGAELARQGREVFGLRRSREASPELAAAGIRPLVADITEPADLAKLPPQFDWVVNCVSASGGGAEAFRRVHVQGTRNLVEWLSAAAPKKFVYTSSTGVYGQDDGSLVTESAPTEPATDTGRILVEAERVLLDAAQHRGFPAVMLRVAGIYGPGRGHYLKQFLQNEARIEGDGERFLNMIHRDDVVGAILAALARGQPGAIYNACDDEPVSQADLFRWLARELARPMPPSVADDPDAPPRRGATSKRVSNQRLRGELSWQPRFPTFRDGFRAELLRLREEGQWAG
jgi:nucleoside-diphosphate-sugar epimerase